MNVHEGQGRQPWASACALLAGCGATLLGVWRAADPEVILARAAGAAVMIGLVTAAMCSLWRGLLTTDDDDDE